MPLSWVGRRDEQARASPGTDRERTRKVAPIQARTLAVSQTRRVLKVLRRASPCHGS